MYCAAGELSALWPSLSSPIFSIQEKPVPSGMGLDWQSGKMPAKFVTWVTDQDCYR